MTDFFDKVMDGDLQSIFTIAALWFAFFTVQAHITIKPMTHWPSVIGNLTEFKISKGDGSLDVTMTIRYNFLVNGQEYKGRRLSCVAISGSSAALRKRLMAQVEHVEDDKVVIYYNPKNPKKSILLKPKRLEYGILTICYLGTFLCIYIAVFGPMT